MDALDATPLCPSPMELQLDQVVFVAPELVVTARARRRVVACPACGRASVRVHSRYQRTLADLPWHGLRVHLNVRVRRFFCDVPGCPRRIFTERLPKTTAPYARRTARAAETLEAIGFGLGGRPGARLAHLLGLSAAPTTVLMQVHRASLGGGDVGASSTPRVLGVDDWAMRRGRTYGTILVDLERQTPIDLLPDRRAETLAAWLRMHPGVELISRDRGGAYAEGARNGAPAAIQIADRFHLMRNLVDALDRICTRHAAALRLAAVAGPDGACAPEHEAALSSTLVRPGRRRRVSGLPTNSGGPTRYQQQITARRTARMARYTDVVALRAAGHSRRAIAQRLHLDRRTVAMWLAAGRFPERAPRARPAHVTDPFRRLIEQRYSEGLINGSALTRELRAAGYQGSVAAVNRVLAMFCDRDARQQPASAHRAGVGGMPPGSHSHPRRRSSRATAFLLRTPRADLTERDAHYLTALERACPPIAAARASAETFVTMFAARDSNAFAPWLASAEVTELRSFAAGIRRDRDAVLAAIIFPWSNGQVEGQVGRLKLLKRSMYGRCGFRLLRQRVLHRSA